MKTALRLFSVAAIISLTACSSLSNNDSDNTKSTADTLASISGNWQLTSISTKSQPAQPPQEPLTLTLQVETAESGRLYGNAGCNRFFGGYQIESGALKIGPLASTMMACENLKMAQEREFLSMLEKLTVASQLSNDELSLSNQDQQSQLILKPQEKDAQ